MGAGGDSNPLPGLWDRANHLALPAAASQGVEPRLPGSEPGVLPL